MLDRSTITESVLDAGLTRVAQYSLDQKAKVFRSPNGIWVLELPNGQSEIGNCFEAARDALTILIRESRKLE